MVKKLIILSLLVLTCYLGLQAINPVALIEGIIHLSFASREWKSPVDHIDYLVLQAISSGIKDPEKTRTLVKQAISETNALKQLSPSVSHRLQRLFKTDLPMQSPNSKPSDALLIALYKANTLYTLSNAERLNSQNTLSAEKHLKTSVDIYRKYSNQQGQHYLEALLDLAETDIRNKQYTHAEALLAEAQKIQDKKHYGRGAVERKILDNQGKIQFFKYNNLEKALKLKRKAFPLEPEADLVKSLHHAYE